MAITVQTVETAKQRNDFITFEWTINRTTPNWISPLLTERKDILNLKKNPFYKHSKMRQFLACKDGELAGRIAAIINYNHNSFRNDKAGFWGFFDAINDQEVTNALFRSAAEWLKSEGRDQMYGPMNPSTNDEAGLLIEGFDTPPYIMMTHNPDYYPALVDGFGNRKAMDLFAWLITTADAKKGITEKMMRVSEKIKKKYNITIEVIRKKNLNKEIRIIQDIYNNAWSENWGFVPLTDEEIDHIAAKLKQIAQEELLLMAYKDGVPIGFSITLPNVNEVLAKIPNGRLLPTGLFKLIRGIPKIQSVRVLILGVKKEFQFIGLGSIFYIDSILKAIDLGIKVGEMSWILENNLPMNRAIEAIGSKCYKTYRVYVYDL